MITTVTLRHITDLTALRLEEFPDCRRAVAPGAEATTLGGMIAVAVEDVARDLTRNAPLSSFSSALDIRRLIRSDTDWGEDSYAEVELPEDFCRLTSLRLPGWGITLHEDYPGDELRARLCEEAPEWMLRRPMRPWLRLYGADGVTRLRFGPPTGTDPIEASYIPLPRFDADDEWLLNFDDTLLPQLADRLARLIRPT